MDKKAEAKKAKEEAKAEKKRLKDEKDAEKKRVAAEKKAAKQAEKEKKAAEKEAKKKGLPSPDEVAAAEAAKAAEEAAAAAKAAEEAAKAKAAEDAAKAKAAEEAAAATAKAAEEAAAAKAAEEATKAKAAEEAAAATAKAAEEAAAAKAAAAATVKAAEEQAAAAKAAAPAAAATEAPAADAAGAEPAKKVGFTTPPQSGKSPRKSNIARSRSVRRSLHGAPQPKVAGVQVVEAKLESPGKAEGATEEALGQEVVEDDCDEVVGNMNEGDAEKTFQYLGQEVHKIRNQIAAKQGAKPPFNIGFTMAYESMKEVGREQPTTNSFHEHNKLKNRYGNISAYDHSRVVLPQINDDPDTDYINANWIQGYKKDRGYVATQGPVPNSFISFWRMIWHVQAEVIVMVTHEIEKNRLKCHRYWPDPTSTPPVKKLQYGSIFVTHISSVPHKNFTVRTFDVEQAGEVRRIKQFAYTAWPDHGVPLTTNEILGFRNAINVAREKKEIPLVVHCSAGVGRTGTYIAVDRIMDQALDMGGDILIDNMVTEMRKARNFMVQTVIQYIFIHRAINDGLTQLLSGEHSKATAQQIQKKQQEEAKAEMEKARIEAEKAEAARQETLKQEAAEIEEAKKALEDEGADTTKKSGTVNGMISIKDRIEMLNNAEERWLEAYRQSMMDWNERNKEFAEEYDTSSSLTPLQSRIEALRQKGLVFA